MSIQQGFARTFPITPSDSADLTTPCDGLLVTVAGNLVFRNTAGVSITITGAAAGQHIPIKTRRVMATGTTATVIAMWGQ